MPIVITQAFVQVNLCAKRSIATPIKAVCVVEGCEEAGVAAAGSEVTRLRLSGKAEQEDERQRARSDRKLHYVSLFKIIVLCVADVFCMGMTSWLGLYKSSM